MGKTVLIFKHKENVNPRLTSSSSKQLGGGSKSLQNAKESDLGRQSNLLYILGGHHLTCMG